jgi:hypothetical protein
MLERLTAPPFRQAKAVPKDAMIEQSQPETWWRSDSPRQNLGEEGVGVPHAERDVDTGRFHTSIKTGPGTACHYQETSEQKAIPGYGGFIPGKVSGNAIGKNFAGTLQDAEEYLKNNNLEARTATLRAKQLQEASGQ